MMRGILQWLRLAAPPRWTPLLLLPVLGNEVAYGWAIWRGVGPVVADELLKPRDICLLLAAVVLGCRRAYAFQPLYHQDYLHWLKLTPWTSRVPLPVGPVHLMPQDALWFALALLLWHHPQYSRLYLPACFLLGYLMVSCDSCRATGLVGFAYLLAFGLGEVVRQWYQPLAALTVAVWLYLAAWVGLRRMMARFPWNLPWYWGRPSLQAIAEEVQRRMLGWPLDQLHSRVRDPRVSYRHGALLSLLMGWWLYCLGSLITNPLEAAMIMQMALMAVAAMCIIQRTFRYWIDYRPPISFWGRLWTLRWLIPRYDHFLIAPISIFFTARELPRMFVGWGLPAVIALPATVSMVAFLAFSMPPSFERWRLTGFHRIVPGSTNKQEFLKL